MGHKTKAFFSELISGRDVKSSRRFVTLITALLFILTCLTILILLIVLFISVTKLQGMNIEALKIICNLLMEVIKFEAAITIGGLGFITVPDLVKILIAWFQKKEPVDPTTVDGPKID